MRGYNEEGFESP